MKRYLLSTLLFACLAAWVSAQPATTRLRPDQLLQLLKRNEGLYRHLVKGSLDLAKPSASALTRSQSYDPLIRELEEEIKRAAGEGDAARVAELGKHLNTMLEKGLAPNLEKARKLISPGSPDESKLFDLRDLTRRMSGDVEKTLSESRIARSSEAKALVGALKQNREQIEKKVEASQDR